MKTRITLLASALFALLLLATGCHKKDDKKTSMPTPEVAVALPVQDSVTLHKTYPGYLTAHISADVVARADGTIISKNYESGQHVSKGQVLFTLSNPKYADAVKQANAQLATATAQRDYAVKHLAALQKALQAEAVSRMDVVSAQNALDQANASIAQAQASLSTASTNMGYLTVRAPVSGIVSDNLLSVGNYVAGEMSPVKLCTVYDDSQMVATFSIEAAAFESMTKGTLSTAEPIYRAVPINFDAPLAHTYTTDLFYSAPSINQGTGTIEIKGTIPNPYGELRDGMYVTFAMPYGTVPDALLVRDASISTDQLGKYLYVVNDSNKVVYTPIKVGEVYRDSLRLVTSGLKPSDRYVTDALLTVRPGLQVKPVLKK